MMYDVMMHDVMTYDVMINMHVLEDLYVLIIMERGIYLIDMG